MLGCCSRQPSIIYPACRIGGTDIRNAQAFLITSVVYGVVSAFGLEHRMGAGQELQAFLSKNRISADDWDKSGCDWGVLQAIAADYETNQDLLRETAEAFARIIQKFPAVHSVRWRVKDVHHLLEKIVRKKAKGAEKYRDVTVDNYQRIITDLVGIRALHLFKDECFDIDQSLRSVWAAIETPVAYLRKGDDQTLRELFEKRAFAIEDHAAGYRSVHYVFPTSLTQREIHVEVQVRTIFEEAWSEIDHRIRYPNFETAPQVDYFLTIFNRTAGSADEMGSFVRDLSAELKAASTAVSLVERERDDALEKMKELLSQMSAAEQQGQQQTEVIGELKSQLSKLQKSVDDYRRLENQALGVSSPSAYESLLKFGKNEPNDLLRLAALGPVSKNVLSGIDKKSGPLSLLDLMQNRGRKDDL